MYIAKMAEDDEIDVLGDFSLDNLLSKNETMFDSSALVSQNSDLLKCDYTIHPQWLLDKPSTNPALWYSNANSDYSSELGAQSELAYGSSNESQISTENCITDESGWTEKEKNLLNRGIEIFGKSNVRLSQFIGSRTPAEVKYFLKNFYSDVQLSYSNVSSELVFENNCVQETVVSSTGDTNAVLDDAEIPASIEEVIAAVSTAKPTVPVSRKKVKANRGVFRNSDFKVNYNDIPSGHSLLKSSYRKREIKPDRKKGVRKQKPKHLPDNISRGGGSKKAVKFKFKAKLKEVRNKSGKNYNRKPRKNVKAETVPTKTPESDVLIVTGKGLSVPVCDGEEVIKINNEMTNSDSDVEIDIEDSGDDTPNVNVDTNIAVNTDAIVESKKPDKSETQDVDEAKAAPVIPQKKIPQLSELDESVANELMSMEYPKSEYVFADNKITDLEKFVHFEFFEGRPTKTPMRYIKIRNHILNTWKNIKPTYVTKTSIRQGLKQCGDVNCIGRIHQFLEQIGAINLNCAQINYVRPLYEMVVANHIACKDKSSKDIDTPQKFDVFNRARNKKRYINDGEGGYTLAHDERGDIINTTVVNEEPIQKQRTYLKKPIIRLIYCRAFTDDCPQEYIVQLNLSVLLLMDLHSHTSFSEVMGLVGGHCDKKKKILTITRYEPCKNIATSSIHCDMCPVTQAKAADILHGEHLDILGWFHSHPTFAPEPSQQDVDTQLSVQQWIGTDKPCLGIILSPFSSHGALIASPYRCMIVDKLADQFVPFKFKVDVISCSLNVNDLLNRAWRIFNFEYVDLKENRVDFRKPYFQDHSLSHLEKYISSVKMHLAKCSDTNKMTCDAIIQGLSDICTNNL